MVSSERLFGRGTGGRGLCNTTLGFAVLFVTAILILSTGPVARDRALGSRLPIGQVNPLKPAITPSPSFNCSGVGEVAGNLNFDVAIGYNETLTWYVVVYGCTTKQPMEVQHAGVVSSPPNTTAPRITVSPKYWTAPRGTSQKAILVTIHMPFAKRDLGKVWTAGLTQGTYLSAGGDVVCPGGGCVTPGVVKLFSISTFNPAAPRAAVSLAGGPAGYFSTPPNLTLDPSTVAPGPGSGKFVPTIDLRSGPYANISVPINVTYSNLYGPANGSLVLTVNGHPTSTQGLTNFSGTTTEQRNARLVPGPNYVNVTLRLHNRYGSSAANATVARAYSNSSLDPIWVNFTNNASVSPGFFASFTYWIYSSNGTQVETYSVTAGQLFPLWAFGPGYYIQITGKVYLTTLIPGTFSFTATVGGGSLAKPYDLRLVFVTP